MKRNVNVFIGVVLCAVLGGCFWWLASADEGDQWSPNEIYSEVHRTSAGGFSHTHASSVSSNNGGVALTLSSPSATFRRRTSSIYAGAHTGASYAPLASSPLASSPLTYGAAPGAGLHLTSSAEIKSFGGGGNGGAAMSYSQSPIANRQSNSGLSNPSLQGGAGVGSISPIAYSTARRGEMSSATGDNPVQMMAEQPTMAMTSTAGMANGFYGGYSAMDYSSTTTYSSTSDYGQYTGMFGGGSRMGIRGRQNGNGSTGNAWWVWLDAWLATNGSGIGSGTDLGNGYWSDYYFNEQALQNAYYDFINNYWNPVMGGDESSFPYEEWKAWFFKTLGEQGHYEYNGHNYYWVPVGDMLPLLLLALLYVLFLAVKSSTSLLKTERSE